MKRQCVCKKIVSFALALSTVFSVGINSAATESKNDNGLFYIKDYNSYKEYLAQYPNAENATLKTEITCGAQANESVRKTIDGTECAVISEGETAEYSFSAEESGFYNIEMLYYPIDGTDAPIKLDMKLDGENPFEETANITLSRKWGFSETVRKDSQDNEIKRDSVVLPEWMAVRLENSSGAGGEALKFYLEAGTHTLGIEATQNSVALAKIAFVKPREIKSYGDVLSEWQKSGYTDASESIELIQAENASGRSDQSIAMENDRTSAATTPYHSFKIRYNCIGGSSWASAGEWIEWDIEAPKSGLYSLVLRFQQDGKSDDVSTRSLTIDGEIPFAEAANITFAYDSSWQTAKLGDGKTDFKFYLEKGQHTVRLTACLGKGAEIINGVSEVLDDLNDIYVNIVMVTGTSPDTNRDYGIAKLLPDVLEKMKNVSTELKELERQQIKLSGNKKGNSTFQRLYDQLDRMTDAPESVPHRLSNFQTNITSLGTWINDNRSQPLKLDYLQFLAPKAPVPKAEKGFFSGLKHNILQFLGSFLTDYSAVGSTEIGSNRKITTWISSGRDQADILRKIINSRFTPTYGVEVELQLVNAGALLSATLANIGPDVSLGIAETEPINYALRNAVVDLNRLEGANEVFSRFHSASLTAFKMDGGVYALPEVMDYPMLFYRKDILSEMGIHEEDLKTWDALLQKVLPELMLSYFDFGLTTDLKSYASLLYQHGGDFYNAEKTATVLDSTEAYTAFKIMTQLYTDYKIPKAFDFANRFRSGQMPLAVTSYTAYNQLSVFAPEIEGKWGMTTLPGIADENGNINNTAAVSVTGAVILKNSDSVDDAWTFLKWWTDGEIQGEYGKELETALGTSARYATANLKAMDIIPWSSDIRSALKKQQENLKGVEQIPGSYYTSRHYEFAFRNVVENGGNIRESLLDACEDITNEIHEKRMEFYGEGEQ